MSEQFLYDRLVILNSIYNNSIQPFRYNEQPASIKTPLMYHQHLLVNTMHKYKERMLRGVLYENKTINGKLGILGDKEGTGKTLSILAYIASDDPTPHPMTCELSDNSSKYFFSCELQPMGQSITTNLIIVPPTLFNQWKQESTKHTSLKYVAFDTKRSIKGDNLLNTIITSSFILTTSKCYRHVQQYANENNIKWNNIFIDEASTIYFSPSDPKLQFQFLWLVTSVWIPLIFKNPFLVKSDMYHLRDRIQMHPNLDTWLTDDTSNHHAQVLESSSFLKDYLPFYHSLRWLLVLRNSNETLNTIQLPPIITRNIVCHQTFSLYSLISYYKFKNLKNITSQNIPKLFRALSVEYMDMDDYIEQQDETKHRLIQAKLEENECVICFEKTEHPTIVNCCHNVYCARCLLTNMLVSQKCPTCRESLTPESLCCFSDEEPITLNTKAEELVQLIKDNRESQFIVYTSFNCIYYHIYNDLDQLGIRAERIESNIYSINRTIKNYMDGTTQVLFVCDMDINTIKGLTLTNTTYLVFYHELPSYEQQQVLIRSSQRIGKKTPLEIVHLNSDIEL